MTGPLSGVRVVELAGIGPGPHACMVLADLGADVIRVDRPGGQFGSGGRHDYLTRGRPNVALDLKHPDAVATVLRLVESADVLVEGLRPGVTERLGLGPDDCLARNPRLVYGRMTGWGQTGPLAQTAGHDLTYLAVAGTLYGLGQEPARPHFPANLLGDFGGGSTYLVVGILAALVQARVSGQGQVVDAAIVDGVAHLNAMYAGHLAAGLAQDRRDVNLLGGGAPYYDVYETADGRHLAVAALEPQFYEALVDGLGIRDRAPDRDDLEQWPALRDADRRDRAGPAARRVGRGLRRDRRLRGPGADDGRGGRAPAPRSTARRTSTGASARSPPRRRGSPAPRPSWARRRRRGPARTPARRWPPGGSRTSTP